LTRSLSIIIPAYNEERRLTSTLERIHGYLAGAGWKFSEVVVVDDGSRDGTAALVDRFAAQASSVRLLRNPGNRGKGYSVRHGMLDAKGEWALFTDADLSSPIEELEKLWIKAQEARAQVAIGSRALDRSLIGTHQPLVREYAGRAFNLAVRITTGLPFWDTQCGFKLFETRAAREIFRRQQIDRFGFDVEVLFIARKLGYSAVEVPVRWNDVAGTKVSLLNGLMAFLDPLQVRLNQLKGKYR